jgi:hypothetical protein
VFRNVVSFYGEELLVPRPTPKLEGHPLSAVRDCLFNVFAATVHIRRPFLHPQPEDPPYRGDRDPLMELVLTIARNCSLKTGTFITTITRHSSPRSCNTVHMKVPLNQGGCWLIPPPKWPFVGNPQTLFNITLAIYLLWSFYEPFAMLLWRVTQCRWRQDRPRQTSLWHVNYVWSKRTNSNTLWQLISTVFTLHQFLRHNTFIATAGSKNIAALSLCWVSPI